MAERRLLTDRTLQALKAAKSGTRYEIMDANIQSLGVRVYDKADKKGRATHRTFFLLSRFPGSANPTRRALGTYADAPAPPDTLSLDQARQKAGNWIDLISKGTDPRDDEQRIKDEAAAAKAEDNRARAAKIKNSFATVAETYIADRADKRRASSDAQEIRRMLVGEWDATPIADITPRNVRDLIDRIKVRAPYDARNAWTHLTGIFKWAVHDDLIAASPLASLDKKLIFRNVKIAPRQRSLSDDEIFAYWRAAGRLSYPAGPFYKLLLLTGVRLNELADASWSEFHPELRRLLRQRKPVDWSTIDDKFKAWTVPPERFKSDAEHLVALSDEALRLIETLPTFAGCDFLFTVNGRSPVWIGDKYKKRLDARMLRTVKALARVRGDDPARVTLKHWVHHDLRRVVRTGLSALKVEDHVAEIVIGHGRKGIQRTYDVHKYADEARDALVAWAERVRGVRHRLNYAHQRTPTACRLSPELADMLSAQKAILDRLVPALRATEMTGKDGSALIPDAPKQSNRQTARALLSLLASGVPTPGQSESEDDEENNERAPTISGTTFTDSDTPGASPLPSEALRTAAGGWAPPVSSDSSNFPAGGKSPPEIGEHKLIGPNGASIQLVKITPDGRERWTVFGGDGADWGGVWGKDAAEAKCEQLVEARKI